MYLSFCFGRVIPTGAYLVREIEPMLLFLGPKLRDQVYAFFSQEQVPRVTHVSSVEQGLLFVKSGKYAGARPDLTVLCYGFDEELFRTELVPVIILEH